MVDILLTSAIALILGLAAFFILRAKKKGVKCIGCPDSGSCGSGGCCGSCAGCSGCSGCAHK